MQCRDDAEAGPFLNRLYRRLIGDTTAGAERNAARAPVDEPIGCNEAETTDATSNEKATLATEAQCPVAGDNHPILATNWRTNDDLADLAGILHQPEGTADLVVTEGTIRQRHKCAALEQFTDLGEYPLGDLRQIDQKLIGVDAEIADVAAERTQADLAV
ncbi:hypothetical protein D3C73_565810 [compost metagenome]